MDDTIYETEIIEKKLEVLRFPIYQMSGLEVSESRAVEVESTRRITMQRTIRDQGPGSDAV